MMNSLILLTVAILSAASADKPHVVLLVLDDMGWADVGYHGSNFATPQIDALMNESLKLERMYVMPQCSPTRAALLTGHYSFHTGMQHWTTLMPGSTAAIPMETKTIAEIFKAAGYQTHHIGKWHLGYHGWENTPTGRGFDSSLGYLQGQIDYYTHSLPCGQAFPREINMKTPYGDNGNSLDFWNNTNPIIQQGRYTGGFYNSEAANIIASVGQGKTSGPFFLYYAEQNVHIPLQLPDDPSYLNRCQGVTGGSAKVNRTVLCAMAGALDGLIGSLVSGMKLYPKVWDNAIIWAVSDNGGMTHWGERFPASASSNYPLRGGKTTLFEGGVRSVSFITGGLLPASRRGATHSGLLHAVDILPSLACGFAEVCTDEKFDGVNAWSLLMSNSSQMARTEIPLNVQINPIVPLALRGDGLANYSALIMWPYKLIVGSTSFVVPKDMDGYWSIDNYTFTPAPVDGYGPKDYRLYNIETDIREESNLAASMPEIVKSMTQRLQSYWASSDNGYTDPQLNFPERLANPALHNWTWKPFKVL